MVDTDVRTRLSELAAHLDATAERPMRPDVTHWVAEADAVASDVAGAALPAEVVRERVGHVRDLLANVEETGDEEADEHVAAARELADEVLDSLDSDD
jgi:hypothetical protein